MEICDDDVTLALTLTLNLIVGGRSRRDYIPNH